MSIYIFYQLNGDLTYQEFFTINDAEYFCKRLLQGEEENAVFFKAIEGRNLLPHTTEEITAVKLKEDKRT